MATEGIDTSNTQEWPDYVRENYAALRLERGWSWTDLADHLRSMGANELAGWAGAQDVDLSVRVKPEGTSESAVSPAAETR